MSNLYTPPDDKANSYVTLDEANAYFSGVIKSDFWPSSDAYEDSEDVILKKEAALLESRRTLDRLFGWFGNIADFNQVLRWPRTGVYDLDERLIPNDTVPEQIKNSQCDLALYLLQSGGLNVSDSNLTALKVGPIGLNFSTDVGVTVGIPDFIINSLKSFGKYLGPVNNQIKNSNSIRS